MTSPAHSARPASPAAERRPDRRLPVLYFAFAHLCLVTAFAVPALAPAAVAGFFYHPRMLAVVHLVTLGWITSAILGSLYLVAPMALKASLPAGRGDLWAFGAFSLGASGMAAHFWLDEVSGMAMSAALVLAAALWVVGRVARALAPARIPLEIKLHFFLAFFNLALAALLGVAIAADKWIPFWPGYRLARVFAHAHLAAVGWALMTVMGAAYRLLPMFLPAAPPRGFGVWASLVSTEAGVLALAAGLGFRQHWLAVSGAALVAVGVAAFLAGVIWMTRNPRPAPAQLRRPDLAMAHVPLALLWLLLALGLGLALLLGPAGEWKLRAVMAYGVAGLVGFLAQMVVGVGGRLFPLFSFVRIPRRLGEPPSIPTPLQLPDRRAQAATLLLWAAGAPCLAVGLALDLYLPLRAGAGALLAAALVEAVHWGWMLRAGSAE